MLYLFLLFPSYYITYVVSLIFAKLVTICSLLEESTSTLFISYESSNLFLICFVVSAAAVL